MLEREMVGWMVLLVLQPTASHSVAEPVNAPDTNDVVYGVHMGCAQKILLPDWDLAAAFAFLHSTR